MLLRLQAAASKFLFLLIELLINSWHNVVVVFFLPAIQSCACQPPKDFKLLVS